MTRHSILLGAAAALFAALACTVSFDPSGQPCDSFGRCSPGYVCKQAKCVAGTNPAGSSGGTGKTTGSSAGASGSSGRSSGSTGNTGSAGTTGSAGSGTSSIAGTSVGSVGSSSSTGTSSAGSTGSCVCPVEDVCGPTGGCVARSPVGEPSHSCFTDSDCANDAGASYACLTPAGGGAGICSQECSATSFDCATADHCVPMINGRGEPISLCLPAVEGPTPCYSDSFCRGYGLVCMYYLSLSTNLPSLPVSFCDSPSSGGQQAGTVCTVASQCASGNCFGATTPGECVTNCGVVDGGCGSSGTCQIVQIALGPVHASVCLGTVRTLCSSCASNSQCGPDAPTCANGRCNQPCDQLESQPCGAGTSCFQNYCVVSLPDGGGC